MKNLIKKNYGLLIVGGVVFIVGFFLSSRQVSSQTTSGKTEPRLTTATSRLGAGILFAGRMSWVGSTPPSEAESLLLLEVMTNWTANPNVAAGHLEEFASLLTNSPWAPTVHAHLGQFYRSRGQVTKALEHWQTAWVATQAFETGGGKRVADYTLANWTRLLMVLGRVEELGELYQQYGNRRLDSGPLTQMWLRTHEKYLRMGQHPEDSFKCGIYAVDRVGQTLKVDYERGKLLETASKPTGFSLNELEETSTKHGLELLAVRRNEGNVQLPVPSVIHWRQEHYAAIVGTRGNLYEVTDPSGLGLLWLTADEINAEASGYFLVPKDQVPVNFGFPSEAEAALVFGRASSCPPNDPEDTPCCPCPPGTGGSPGTGAPGLGEGGCGPCGRAEAGMPIWRITEPYLNLWIEDEPLRYQPAKGPAISFKLRYKQRDEGTYSAAFIAPGWNCDWLATATCAAYWGGDDYYPYYAVVYRPGGGLF